MAPFYKVWAIAATALLLAPTRATDVFLYDEEACGTQGGSCRNQPAGKCCFGMDLYQSCEAINPRQRIVAYARQSGELCGAVVGRSDFCFSDGGLGTISGCIWMTSGTKRDADAELEEKGASNDTAGCQAVTHFFRRYGSEVLFLPFDSDEYLHYSNMRASPMKDDYLYRHAEIVRDI